MKKTYIAVLLVILAIGFFWGVSKRSGELTIGAVSRGEEYTSATTTDATWNLFQSKTLVLQSAHGVCVMGSLAVTNTTLGAKVTIKDATSTTDLSGTTIIEYASTTPAGTHYIDYSCRRGIVIETTTGNVASSTFFYKP